MKINKLIAREKFLSTSLPYWYQLYGWIIYLWRYYFYRLNKFQVYKRCCICQGRQFINKRCKKCGLDYQSFQIFEHHGPSSKLFQDLGLVLKPDYKNQKTIFFFQALNYRLKKDFEKAPTPDIKTLREQLPMLPSFSFSKFKYIKTSEAKLYYKNNSKSK